MRLFAIVYNITGIEPVLSITKKLRLNHLSKCYRSNSHVTTAYFLYKYILLSKEKQEKIRRVLQNRFFEDSNLGHQF